MAAWISVLPVIEDASYCFRIVIDLLGYIMPGATCTLCPNRGSVAFRWAQSRAGDPGTITRAAKKHRVGV